MILKESVRKAGAGWMNLPLRAKGLVVVAIPLFALSVAALLFSCILRHNWEAEGWVEHAFEVRSEAQSCLWLALDADSAVRGHLLTRKAEWLNLEEKARTELSKCLSRLEVLQKDHPAQIVRLSGIKKLSGEMLAILGDLRHRAAEGEIPPELVKASHQAMSTLRAEVAALQRDELRKLDELQRGQEGAKGTLLTAIILATSLGSGGGLLAALLFTTGVVRRIERLQRDACRLGEKLPLLIPLGAKDEIGRLADILFQAGERLRQGEEERNRYYKALNQSNFRLTSILESINEAFFSVDRDWRFTYLNPEAERVLQRRSTELVGRDLWEMFPEAAGTSFDIMYRRAMSENTKVEFEEFYPPLNCWFEARAFPTRDGLSVYFHNISGRKQSEQALRESEQRFRAIFEEGPIGVTLIDSGFRLASVNHALCEMLEYDEGELKNAPVISILHPADANRTVALAEDLFAGRLSQYRAEQRFLTKNHRAIWLNVTATLMHDQEGAPPHALAMVENITGRKQAEEELQWESSVMAALSDLYKPLISPDTSIEDMAKIVLSRARSLTRSEHGFATSIDMTTGDNIGHTLTDTRVGPGKAASGKGRPVSMRGHDGQYTGLWGHALNTRAGFYTNSPSTHPASAGTPTGHTPIERFLSVPVLLGQELVGQIALANSNEDYTDRDLEAAQRLADFYALAIHRKRAEEQTKAALREKEVLLREIHHRVKNNLQVISSLLRLQSGCLKDEQVLELLKQSQNRVRSMAIVHEQLHRSRDLSKINFGEYVRNLAASLFCSYGIDSSVVALRVEVDDVDLGIDTAIPCGLILHELAANSLRHAFPAGRKGEICIRLRARRDGRVVLTVGDNGIGMPAETEMEDPKSLGLRLVRILADQIDGEVKRSHSRGTRFQISFRDVNHKEGN